MVQKGPLNDDSEDFLKKLEEEVKTSQTTPQVPVEEKPTPEICSEGELASIFGEIEKTKPTKIAATEYPDDEGLELLSSLSDLGSTPEEEPEQKLAEDKPLTESVAQPVNSENDPSYDLAQLFSENLSKSEIEDLLSPDKDKPVQAEVKPAEEEIKSLEESPEDSDFLDSLSDILGGPDKQKKEDDPDEFGLKNILGGDSEEQPTQIPVENVDKPAGVKTPTPKKVYEPNQELTSENYFGETGSFDESERISDDFSDVLNEHSSDEDESENLTETPAQVPVQNVEAPQAKAAETKPAEQLEAKVEEKIEMPEDLFLDNLSSEKSTEQIPAQTVEDTVKAVTEEQKPNPAKQTPWVSFDDVGGKGKLALYCGAALLFGTLAFYSAPYLDAFVKKYIEPYSYLITQYDNKSGTKKDSNKEETSELKTEEQKTTTEKSTETKTTTEKPSLKELFYKRYHK